MGMNALRNMKCRKAAGKNKIVTDSYERKEAFVEWVRGTFNGYMTATTVKEGWSVGVNCTFIQC